MKAEFYFDKTGTFQKKIYVKFGEQIWTDFELLSEEEVETMFCLIKKLNAKAHSGLLHLSRFLKGKKNILRQFIHCNWTVFDKKWDINDRSLDFEYIECPFKHNNNCPYQGKGIVCIKHENPC